MSNCSSHPKSVAGESDMKVLAQQIGDLNYETLCTLLWHLSNKIHKDGQKDFNEGRTKLSHLLFMAQMDIYKACKQIQQAWYISKPFMNNTNKEK